MNYSFLNSFDGYSKEMHFHGRGDFGLSVSYTSHIESIWSKFKEILKLNFIPFLREPEWYVKNKAKSLNSKFKECSHYNCATPTLP